MLSSVVDLVFLGTNVVRKEKDGQLREYRFIRFANPVTFENFSLPYREGIDFTGVKKGDKVILGFDLETFFNRTQIIVNSIKKK